MLFKLSTNKSVSEAATALQPGVQHNQFGIRQVHNLQDSWVLREVCCSITVHKALLEIFYGF